MAERLGASERKKGAAKKKGKAGKGDGATRGLDKKGAATKSQGGPEQPSAQANASNRKKIIVAVMRRLDEIDARREALNAEKKEQMARIKALDMKMADFGIARRFYLLEGDDRDLLFDTLHETFAAMGIGGQLDFLPAMEQDEDRRADAAEKAPKATVTKAISTEETIARAKQLGTNDSAAGKTIFNPYDEGTPEALAYTAAYNEDQKRVAMQFGESSGNGAAARPH